MYTVVYSHLLVILAVSDGASRSLSQIFAWCVFSCPSVSSSDNGRLWPWHWDSDWLSRTGRQWATEGPKPGGWYGWLRFQTRQAGKGKAARVCEQVQVGRWTSYKGLWWIYNDHTPQNQKLASETYANSTCVLHVGNLQPHSLYHFDLVLVILTFTLFLRATDGKVRASSEAYSYQWFKMHLILCLVSMEKGSPVLTLLALNSAAG